MEKGPAMYRKSLDSIAIVASALLSAGTCLPPGRAIADTGSPPVRLQLAGWDMAPDRITTVDIDPGLLVTLDQAAAPYKQLAAADVASAVANIDKMLVAARGQRRSNCAAGIYRRSGRLQAVQGPDCQVPLPRLRH
jgi:hypothetical protein